MRPRRHLLVLALILTAATLAAPTRADVLLEEHFDDSNLRARGWFDATNVDIVANDCVHGSCLRYHWNTGDVTPSGLGPLRIEFPATTVVYLRYHARYSANWRFRTAYGPHEIQFLTNADDRWIGPAETHLTAYVEHTEGRPTLTGQDTLNIDQARLNTDLTHTTERRGAHGCNGDADGYGVGDCYNAGSLHRNGKRWGDPGFAVFTSTPGRYFQGDWHDIIVEFRLNDVTSSSTKANGHVRYWFDGAPVVDIQDMVWRTGANPAMAFRELVVGTYYHDGAPEPQDWFIDELLLATDPNDVGLGFTGSFDAGRDGSNAGMPFDAGVPFDGSPASTEAGAAGIDGQRPGPAAPDTTAGCACGIGDGRSPSLTVAGTLLVFALAFVARARRRLLFRSLLLVLLVDLGCDGSTPTGAESPVPEAGSISNNAGASSDAGADARTDAESKGTDAAPGAGALPDAATECEHKKAEWIFCEDFEGPNFLSQWQEVAYPERKSLETDKSHVRAGKTALKLSFAPGSTDGAGWMHFWWTPAARQNDVFVRWYVQYSTGFDYGGWDVKLAGLGAHLPGVRYGPGAGNMPDGTWYASRLLSLGVTDKNSGANPKEPIFYYYHQGQGSQWGDFGPQNRTPSVRFNDNQWYCLEIGIKPNTVGLGDGEQTVWIDGVEKAKHSGIRWRTESAVQINDLFQSAWIGEPHAISEQYRWEDNYVISTSRIGCL